MKKCTTRLKSLKLLLFDRKLVFTSYLMLIIWFFITRSPWEIHRQAKKSFNVENLKTIQKNLKAQLLLHNRSNTSPYQAGISMNFFLTYDPWL
jgi:hypothetical protein